MYIMRYNDEIYYHKNLRSIKFDSTRVRVRSDSETIKFDRFHNVI